MKEMMDNSRVLQGMRSKGHIEFIGEREKLKLMNEFKVEKQKQIRREKAKDAALDNILLDRPAAQAAEEGIIVDDHDKAVEINMDQGNVRTLDDRTEAEKMIQAIGNIDKG